MWMAASSVMRSAPARYSASPSRTGSQSRQPPTSSAGVGGWRSRPWDSSCVTLLVWRPEEWASLRTTRRSAPKKTVTAENELGSTSRRCRTAPSASLASSDRASTGISRCAASRLGSSRSGRPSWSSARISRARSLASVLNPRPSSTTFAQPFVRCLDDLLEGGRGLFAEVRIAPQVRGDHRERFGASLGCGLTAPDEVGRVQPAPPRESGKTVDVWPSSLPHTGQRRGAHVSLVGDLLPAQRAALARAVERCEEPLSVEAGSLHIHLL